MAPLTGRTVQHFLKCQIADVNNVMRDIPTDPLATFGLTGEEVDVSAIQDAIKKKLVGQSDFSLTLTGPFDTTAAVTASASGQAAQDHMSGSHTVLQPLAGGLTPRSLGIYIGVQHDWTTGGTEPVFGGIATVIVTSYTCDGAKYSAKLAYAGTATNALAWGVIAITSS